ncbi:hypothetical protein TDB9533_04426 [Thalassocella blandensis]|nr:hypothetical protein TDB9533_04426 [Thalassocella blandensis]
MSKLVFGKVRERLLVRERTKSSVCVVAFSLEYTYFTVPQRSFKKNCAQSQVSALLWILGFLYFLF